MGVILAIVLVIVFVIVLTSVLSAGVCFFKKGRQNKRALNIQSIDKQLSQVGMLINYLLFQELDSIRLSFIRRF